MRTARPPPHTVMLKRDDIELEHAVAPNGNGTAHTLSRGERLALLAEEDELAPRVNVPAGSPMSSRASSSSCRSDFRRRLRPAGP